MPTYAYACTECDHRFEVVQSFSDDSLTVCPECAGRLRKVFNAVGIVFKGGGFYRTDSRSGGSVPTTSGSESGSSSAENGASTSASSDGGSSKGGSSNGGSSTSGSTSSTGAATSGASSPASA